MYSFAGPPGELPGTGGVIRINLIATFIEFNIRVVIGRVCVGTTSGAGGGGEQGSEFKGRA